MLIVISSLIIRATYPERWLDRARDKVEEDGQAQEKDFDWRRRLVSKEGWIQVGANFAHDWEMVWKEILIGFTIAGFVAALVPAEVWSAIFLTDVGLGLPGWLVALENAMVAPFVAAATFIGSMGNIPLATVLNANGVLFAGIMGFIYSDLMAPPLVAVNAKYYGVRTALYIAAVMYVSIVATALILNGAFTLLGIVPESGRAISNVVRFAIDYTFWLNLAALGLTGVMAWLATWHRREHDGHHHRMEGDGPIKRAAAKVAMVVLMAGAVAWAAA